MKLKDVLPGDGVRYIKEFNLIGVSMVRDSQYPITEEKSSGVFVGVRFSDDTKDVLMQIIEQLEIPNPVDRDKLHCTVMYTEKSIPELLDQTGQDHDPSLTATPREFNIFDGDDDKKCLVLLIDCPELVARHNEIVADYGAVYTHDEYKPHITLSYDCNDLDASTLTIPEFVDRLEIVEEYINSIDADW